jgi:hypothetical protein
LRNDFRHYPSALHLLRVAERQGGIVARFQLVQPVEQFVLGVLASRVALGLRCLLFTIVPLRRCTQLLPIGRAL